MGGYFYAAEIQDISMLSYNHSIITLHYYCIYKWAKHGVLIQYLSSNYIDPAANTVRQ